MFSYQISKPFQRYAFDINRTQLYKAALMCAQVINLAFGDNLRASRSESASQKGSYSADNMERLECYLDGGRYFFTCSGFVK
ncbi:hypothetical protein DWZ56_21920 [Lachnotalea sp. AF33-28]|nr:hypothetical protein DWZ56_21920 [Lachnotalea sp. AF33-28]